ncbi:hypothetical protein ACFWAY_26010 [Rhodococcus sp. NPDC059968]|uniref:hypothetical protein n=1 Tax=Rhodococcus sp. NPDC059968 TaxID=3347017 RepID=UPI00367333B7
MLPCIAPFHLDSLAGSGSTCPGRPRWWRNHAEGQYFTIPIRLHTEIVADTRDTYITQGGTPVVVDVVAESAGDSVAADVDLPLAASRRLELFGALNVSDPAERADGRLTRTGVLTAVGRVGRIQMMSIAVGFLPTRPAGWVASQYVRRTEDDLLTDS